MKMMWILFNRYVLSQIYSLEENIVCMHIRCNQSPNPFNYGIENYGDLTGLSFTFAFQIKLNTAINTSYIGSVVEGTQVLFDIQQSYASFSINIANNTLNTIQLNSSTWYLILITQTGIIETIQRYLFY
ncbi:hypothetical protein pb186bvf_005526 [Paramecium bursaria]